MENQDSTFGRPTASGLQATTGRAQSASASPNNFGDTVHGIADQAQEKAGQVVEQARESATSGLESQKERAVDSLGSVAQAVRSTSKELRNQEHASIANFADQAAGQIDRVAGYLRYRDVGQLVSETESFARRQPAIFLGGAFALGLLGARFLKSASHRDNSWENNSSSQYGMNYSPSTGQRTSPALPSHVPSAPRPPSMATSTPSMPSSTTPGRPAAMPSSTTSRTGSAPTGVTGSTSAGTATPPASTGAARMGTGTASPQDPAERTKNLIAQEINQGSQKRTEAR